ncbi:MAG: hypothetical protein RJA69_1627 [Pseudomonadota bacterium]|jgi:hypothetical protein
MQLTGRITTDNLLPLEAYARYRKTHKGQVMAHRRQRTVHLGHHVTLQFESELTIRYQIQEMLHLEKIVEAAGIRAEIDSYAPLVPDGTNWKATVMLEYPNVEERQRELRRLIGVEDRLYIQVPGRANTMLQAQPHDHERVYAMADEDLDRDNETKTSAVHFVRFEFTPAQVSALKSGGIVTLGCDHPHYQAETPIHAVTLASLMTDLH